MLAFKQRSADDVKTPVEGTVTPFADENGSLCLMDADRNVVVLAKMGDVEAAVQQSDEPLVNPLILGGYFQGATFDEVKWTDATAARIALGVPDGVGIVDALPVTDLYEGRLVFLTTDKKLYRYTGAVWTAEIAASDVTGQLTNAQIAAVAAAKVTGQIVSTQVADDAITTPKLAAGAVTTAELAAGAVTAGELAAGAVTTPKLAAGAVTANELAANSVTANKVLAGSIGAAKLSVTQLDAITAVIGVLRTATSGARTEIIDNAVKGFDASNVKRFQLGDLSL